MYKVRIIEIMQNENMFKYRGLSSGGESSLIINVFTLSQLPVSMVYTLYRNIQASVVDRLYSATVGVAKDLAHVY